MVEWYSCPHTLSLASTSLTRLRPNYGTAMLPSVTSLSRALSDTCGAFFPIFIQERGLSIWEQDLMDSHSDFVVLCLKSRSSHSNGSCLHLHLLCFCSSRMLALFYSCCTHFLHSVFSPSACARETHALLHLSLCNCPVKIPRPIESQV